VTVPAELLGPLTPDRSSPVPLWSQVGDDLRRRIRAGEFAPGFPGELTLTEEYEVSRHTIREALRVLRAEGLVVSGRGRTSIVSAPRVRQSLDSLYSLFDSLEAQGIVQDSIVLRLATTSNATVAAYLELPADADLVVLERVRLADGEPFALDTSWMPADLTAPLLHRDFTHSGLYAELKRAGIVIDAATERVTALAAPRHIAEHLSVPAGSPVFSIERRASSLGRGAEWRETFVRGDRFVLESTWDQRSAYVTASTVGSP